MNGIGDFYGLSMINNLRVQWAMMNITHSQVANLISVSHQTIISIESSKYTPSPVRALNLSKVFGKAVEEILHLEGENYR
jgi:putative transcriptional regulator